jgi:hypothetical protein
MKQVVTSQTWPLIFDDWLKINRAIQEKYGETNPEFQNLLNPRQR